MKRSYILAIAFAGALALWMLSGQVGRSEPQETEATEDQAAAEPARLVTVRAKAFRAAPRRTNIVIRGRTEALRDVEVKAETSGRIVELPTREGSLVKQGDVLCRLDQRERIEKVREAEAVLRRRELEYKAASQLKGRGFQSETAAAAAKAELEAAKTEVKRWRIDLENTNVKAPFEGVLDEHRVDVGDLMQVGDVCGIVVDQDPYLVVARVSEQEVTRLTVGSECSARLVGGEVVNGHIRYISTRADTETRTFRVEMQVDNPDGTFRSGVTAEILFPLANILSHLISPGILTLDDAGVLGVRIIENGDTVRFRPVQIVEESDDGVWVTGLPETVTIIMVGQEFVVDGQKVQVTMIDGDGS